MIQRGALGQFIGQASVIRQVKFLLDAALIQHTPAPHMVFTGAPGLGKSYLAEMIATHLGAKLATRTGAQIVKSGWLPLFLELADYSGYDVRGFVVNRGATKHLLAFVDECEPISRPLWEGVHGVLQPAQDGRCIFRDATSKRAVEYALPHLALIFATNYLGAMIKNGMAAVDRCRPNIFQFQLYNQHDLESIVAQFGRQTGMRLTDGAVTALAARARGTPRHAQGLTRRCNAMQIVQGKPAIDELVVAEVMGIDGIDADGLTEIDRRYLQALANAPNDKLSKVSLGNILDVDPETLEREYEPWLVHLGLIAIVSGGRTLTVNGRTKLASSGGHGVLRLANPNVA